MKHDRSHPEARRPWRYLALLFVALFGTLSGCSSKTSGTVPVYGKVVFEDGTSPKIGNVEFRKVVPASSQEPRIIARGAISQDGSFQLTTFEPNDGALPGSYDVICQQFIITEDRSFEAHGHGKRIPAVYGDYGTSGLQAVIQTPQNANDHETNKIVLKLRIDQADRPESE